jgi:two-component system, OmpR family, KDP operon response regulator KdpE
MEWSLLKELASKAGKMVAYRQLLQNCWGPEYGDDKGLLHEAVSRLRSKIEHGPDNPRYIVNIPGTGYRLQMD